MPYSHSTNHSFKPKLEFWKSMEHLFNSFPYWQEWDKYRNKQSFISFYEIETKESFDVKDDDTDVYGDKITELFVNIIGGGNVLFDDLPEDQRKSAIVRRRVNYTGKIIKFLSNHISNPESVNKFQQFFELAYKFLVNIRNFDINNPIIRRHGLNDINATNYGSNKADFIKNYINNDKGLIKNEQFKEHFNSACRKHAVPFVMYAQNEECYVVHITDIFIKKTILNTPIFFKNNGLNQANKSFIKAVTLRDRGDYKESLNNLRQAIENVRDEIYRRYNLGNPTVSVYNDLEKLFEAYRDQVFDFYKIPEFEPKRLEKIG